MAFIGILLANIVLLILFVISIVILIVMLVLLILGIVFAVKKKKTLATIFFSIDGAILIIIAIIVIAIYCFINAPKSETFETPDGEKTVSAEIISQMEESINCNDTEDVDDILDEYPELIYYYESSYTSILHKATELGNLEVAECILDHGAEYDDEIIMDHLIYDYSLEYYFGTCNSERFYETVGFMLENGATVTYQGNTSTPNALFQAVWWISHDDNLSDEDIALIELLIEYGASTTEINSSNKSAIDVYYETTYQHSITEDDENYLEIVALLENTTA